MINKSTARVPCITTSLIKSMFSSPEIAWKWNKSSGLGGGKSPTVNFKPGELILELFQR